MDFNTYTDGLRRIYAEMDSDLRLQPPAKPASLETLTAVRGVLDGALRGAWMIADGAASGSPFFARPGFLTAFDFISSKAAAWQRASMEKRAAGYGSYVDPEPRDPRIRAGWFHAGWMPFADFGGGTLLLLSDMSPAPTGTPGQVIGFVHDPDEIVFVAPSFAEFLDLSLKAMDEGRDEYFAGI